ncbi:hypothetical protein HDIA_0772 [Hartmannibacter diazotrophicus]|uniref:Uncharacterized protein n=1 Tax=Hartmannibacter diazotrophicus TaxID=1482074 RepID=A0A2C9D269_9HYPH|nr:hypothetical protein [Hartmannibacter diazotrophicus]SON54313.1 hypothetical protein HDIA_0772 [Hartmannibacter diazotrophicus]
MEQFIWGIVLLLTSAVLQVLTTPKQQSQPPATLADFDFPQFDEGTPQTVYFGEEWADDFFVLWYGNLRNSPIKSSGGKK